MEKYVNWKVEGNKAGDTQDHGDIEDTPNNGEEKEDEKEVGNIWESRKTLLKTIREKVLLFEQFYKKKGNFCLYI